MNITLFTRHEFDTLEKAAVLFDRLCQATAAFVPTHYGLEEPRSVFDVKDFSAPSKLLVGDPAEEEGGLVLKSKAFYCAVFNWSRSRQSCWEIYINESFMKRSHAVRHLVQAVHDLCGSFDIIFGVATEEVDWETKHLSVDVFPDGGESATKVGWTDELDRCLPGVYWITFFGKDLTTYFGREKLAKLPAHKVLDLGENGVMLVLREAPFEPELKERLRHDGAIMASLGADHFFDINAMDKACLPIPGVTQGCASAGTVQDLPEGSLETGGLDEIDVFEQQIPAYPHGAAYGHPSELAEGLVVYLHHEVEEIFDETRASLAALDAYFETQPPLYMYKKSFLWKELIPALGGYLGQMLVGELEGRWVARDPLPTSTVLVGDLEIGVFREAYRCVYVHAKLLAVYDKAVSSRTL